MHRVKLVPPLEKENITQSGHFMPAAVSGICIAVVVENYR